MVVVAVNDPILTMSTKLAWLGVTVSVGVGAATLRTAPEVSVLATAAGATWLGIMWYVSRDDPRRAGTGEPDEQVVATDGGGVKGEDGGDLSEEGVGRTYLKRCPDCEWTISIVDYYCRHCGTRVREEQTQNQHTETHS